MRHRCRLSLTIVGSCRERRHASTVQPPAGNPDRCADSHRPAAEHVLGRAPGRAARLGRACPGSAGAAGTLCPGDPHAGRTLPLGAGPTGAGQRHPGAARRTGQPRAAPPAQPAPGTAEPRSRLLGAVPARPRRRDHRRQQLARLEQLRWQQLRLPPVFPRCGEERQRPLFRRRRHHRHSRLLPLQLCEECRRRGARRAGGQARAGRDAARLGRPAGHPADRRLAGYRHPHQSPGLALPLSAPAERRGAQPPDRCPALCRTDAAAAAEQPRAATRRGQRATSGGWPGRPPRIPLATPGAAGRRLDPAPAARPTDGGRQRAQLSPGRGWRVDDAGLSAALPCATRQDPPRRTAQPQRAGAPGARAHP